MEEEDQLSYLSQLDTVQIPKCTTRHASSSSQEGVHVAFVCCATGYGIARSIDRPKGLLAMNLVTVWVQAGSAAALPRSVATGVRLQDRT